MKVQNTTKRQFTISTLKTQQPIPASKTCFMSLRQSQGRAWQGMKQQDSKYRNKINAFVTSN